MTVSGRLRVSLLAGMTALALSGGRAYTQADVVDPARNPLPNPNPTVIKTFGMLPDGRTWGSTAGVDVGPDGHIWAYDRCGVNTCEGSNVAPILKFDRSSGKLLASFGAGMIVFPHGLHVDRDGNVWVTDGQRSKDGTKGHQVFKFSPEGKVLLTLGKPGGSGEPDYFYQPNDVHTAQNGDIFVSEGHGGGNGRILKFDRTGKFIKQWGKRGTGPSEFDQPHSLAIDSRNRLFVADRANNRIQIFDLEGKFLEEWRQFSRNSGIFIDRNDMLYAADSESNNGRNHGEWKRGIRVGSAKDGKVLYFIPDPADANNGPMAGTSAAEGVAVDAAGNIFGAEVGPRAVKKYVRK